MEQITSNRGAAGWLNSDDNFNTLYPLHIQRLAMRHWTPLRVTKTIVDFLTPGNKEHVLDIGSGVGKFCLAAACYKPAAFFEGIEQRGALVEIAKQAQVRLQVSNANFLHGDFT